MKKIIVVSILISNLITFSYTQSPSRNTISPTRQYYNEFKQLKKKQAKEKNLFNAIVNGSIGLWGIYSGAKTGYFYCYFTSGIFLFKSLKHINKCVYED